MCILGVGVLGIGLAVPLFCHIRNLHNDRNAFLSLVSLHVIDADVTTFGVHFDVDTKPLKKPPELVWHNTKGID